MTGAGSNDTTVLPTETGITKQDVLLGIGVALLTATLLKDR